MFDFKRPPFALKEYILSTHSQNYFYAAPDIFVRQLDVQNDDMLIVGNRDFFRCFTPKEAVIFIKNKLISGLMPLQVRDKMIEHIENVIDTKKWNIYPVFMVVILNMNFLDV